MGCLLTQNPCCLHSSTEDAAHRRRNRISSLRWLCSSDSWYIYYGTVGRRMQMIFARLDTDCIRKCRNDMRKMDANGTKITFTTIFGRKRESCEVATGTRLCTTNVFHFIGNSAKIQDNNSRSYTLAERFAGGFLRLCCAVTAWAGAEACSYFNEETHPN